MKISIGEYNMLFASAEVGMELYHKEMNKLKPNAECMDIYMISKRNANQIVDEILDRLNIKVEEG